MGLDSWMMSPGCRVVLRRPWCEMIGVLASVHGDRVHHLGSIEAGRGHACLTILLM